MLLSMVQFKIFRFKATTDKYLQHLMIQSIRMSDAGEYSVVAGSSISTAHLIVEGKDVHISEPTEKEITVSLTLLLLTPNVIANG